MPVLDSPNSINTRAMADRLAATLGDRPAVLMKSHGAATVGEDLVEAFVLANYLEENAYRQYMALQIGQPYVFSDEELMLCREKLWTPSLFKRTWDHFARSCRPSNNYKSRRSRAGGTRQQFVARSFAATAKANFRSSPAAPA